MFKTEFETEDYKDYIEKYLLAIKNVNDDKYDMLTHKISKYLFYNFNNYLSRIGRPVQFVRHTQIPDNDYALTTLQEKNWPYFIERILEVSEGWPLQLINLGSPVDIDENKIITDTIYSLTVLKNFINCYKRQLKIICMNIFKIALLLNYKK